MTSRRRVHGFHACVHVYVQEVSEWPGTMDNKTLNSLFHRLPCQRSGAPNDQNYSVSESVQMCLCAYSEKSGSRTQGASLQLINRVITFCLQQMWDTLKKMWNFIAPFQKPLMYFNFWEVKHGKEKTNLATTEATIWGVVVNLKVALAKMLGSGVLLCLPLCPGLCHCLVKINRSCIPIMKNSSSALHLYWLFCSVIRAANASLTSWYDPWKAFRQFSFLIASLLIRLMSGSRFAADKRGLTATLACTLTSLNVNWG